MGTQMDYRVFSVPFLPVSHQPRETDSLAFIHACVALSHKGALGSEGLMTVPPWNVSATWEHTNEYLADSRRLSWHELATYRR